MIDFKKLNEIAEVRNGAARTVGASDFPPIDLTGRTAYSANTLIQIDAQCRLIAAKRLIDGPSPAELRANASSPWASEWLRGSCEDQATMLELDARLNAALLLRSAAVVARDTRQVMFLDIYLDLVREACGAPTFFRRETLHPTKLTFTELADRDTATSAQQVAA